MDLQRILLTVLTLHFLSLWAWDSGSVQLRTFLSWIGLSSLFLVFNATTICLEIFWMHCTSAGSELIKESMELEWECWFGRKPAVFI